MRKIIACLATLGLATAVFAAEPKKESQEIKVSGMSCEACCKKVSTALLKVDGVKTADVCNTGKVAKVEFDPSKTSKKALVAAIEKAGFKVEEPKKATN